MKIQVQISRQSENILKDLKRNCRGLFIDEAIIYFAKTPEGRERIERWKKQDSTDIVGSKLSSQDKGKRISFKELAGDFWEE